MTTIPVSALRRLFSMGVEDMRPIPQRITPRLVGAQRRRPIVPVPRGHSHAAIEVALALDRELPEPIGRTGNVRSGCRF